MSFTTNINFQQILEIFRSKMDYGRNKADKNTYQILYDKTKTSGVFWELILKV